MASLQQPQQPWGGGSNRIVAGGSNRIVAINVEGSTPESFPCNNSRRFDDFHDDPNDVQKPGWRKFFSFVGPGFLVAIAYLDPNNLETDLQAGANHGYELLWVVFIGLVFTLLIQSLAANLGVSTGKHLSELCKAEYPKLMKYCLWLCAEIAVIAADIPEVIGTAAALNILFHIPLWVGVLCTGLSTLVILSLQKYGVRKLEILLSMLVFVIAGCFFAEMSYVKPPVTDVIEGIVVPKIKGNGAVVDIIALLGATITPHNLFLHSALVLSRQVPNTVRGVNEASRFFLIEAGFAMFVAFLFNMAVVSVSATICTEDNPSGDIQNRCSSLTLNSASFLLQDVLGKSSSIIYGVALLASGQSSTITGTYAGQFIMQGFLDLRMKNWLSNLMTRFIAIAPSLIVSIVGGSQGAGALIIIASMILSFELPFALIPLLKFSSSKSKMGPHKNSIYIIVISWILGFGIIGINVYYLSTAFVGWLIHNHLPMVGNIFIGIIIFPFMAAYILAIIYLTFRKDTVVTYSEPEKNDPAIAAVEAQIESGLGNPDGSSFQVDNVPYRQDLADIRQPDHTQDLADNVPYRQD